MSLAKFLKKGSASSLNRKCSLKSKQLEYPDIVLQNGLNALGRSRETQIRDSFCSKKQIELNVKLESCEVSMKTVGVNAASVNGLLLNQGKYCLLKHGDIIEMVYGKFPYELTFDPEPDYEQSIKKPKLEQTGGQWDSVDNGKLVIYTTGGVKSSSKIAGFDVDGTIITTKSGRVFPKDTFDWEILFPEIPKKLKTLHEDNYKICFFTNQSGIAKGKIKLDDFKNKVKAITSRLQVPVQVFIAIGDGFNRKPVPGMWQHLSDEKNDGIEIDNSQSFYVGDAAGRPEAGKKRKDHSLADRLFALNIGIPFFTPEEHFLKKSSVPFNEPEFDPHKETKLPLFDPPTKVDSKYKEVVVLMGLPGSGKSHFTKTVMKGYEILNADTLGSVQACLNKCEQFLRSGKSCVIDNTNVDVESRKKFITLSKNNGFKCRCFVMNTSPGQIKHNLAFRQLTDSKHSKINTMILNTMKKKFTSPSTSEGFDEIVKVNVVCDFDSVEHEKIYKMFLADK
ncbi:hypothetical protein ACFFRR_009507 [Megaselia abdita]